MSIARSNGTLVKRDFLSNMTIWLSFDTSFAFTFTMKSFVLLTIYSDTLNGANNLKGTLLDFKSMC